MSDGKLTSQQWKRALCLAPDISDGAKVTGFVFVEAFDFEKGDLWSAQKTIAEKRGKSERAIREHISELVDGGFFTSKRGGAGQANRYVKTLPDRQNSAYLDRQNSAGLKSTDRRKSSYQTGEDLPVQTGENLPHHSNSLKELPEELLEAEPGYAPAPASSSDRSTPFDTGSNLQSESSPVPATPADRKPAGSEKRRSPEFEAACHRIVKVWASEVSEGDAQAIQTALKSNTVDEICDHIRTDVSSVDLEACLQTLRRRKAA